MQWSLREAVGWYGVIAILAAYALSNFGILPLHSLAYIFLNLTGSFGIVWNSWGKKDWQPVALNIAWIVVALVSLARVIFSN